jgi:hypothetical protein
LASIVSPPDPVSTRRGHAILVEKEMVERKRADPCLPLDEPCAVLSALVSREDLRMIGDERLQHVLRLVRLLHHRDEAVTLTQEDHAHIARLYSQCERGQAARPRMADEQDLSGVLGPDRGRGHVAHTTATASCAWSSGRARVEQLALGVDDDQLVKLESGVEKVGLDVPFGRPDVRRRRRCPPPAQAVALRFRIGSFGSDAEACSFWEQTGRPPLSVLNRQDRRSRISGCRSPRPLERRPYRRGQ